MKFFALLVGMILLSFILQEFLPVFDWAYG